MTFEHKLKAYAAGYYVMKAPPVCTRAWGTEDWLNWIDAGNRWTVFAYCETVLHLIDLCGNHIDFASHESDLYVLTKNSGAWITVIDYLKAHDHSFNQAFSNVKGQEWYGKRFIDIPFCLMDAVIAKKKADREHNARLIQP